MLKKHLRFGRGFRVIPGNRGLSGVLSGTDQATVNARRHPIRRGSLLFIERREKHEIKNTGKALLRTLNFMRRRPIARTATRCRAASAERLVLS